MDGRISPAIFCWRLSAHGPVSARGIAESRKRRDFNAASARLPPGLGMFRGMAPGPEGVKATGPGMPRAADTIRYSGVESPLPTIVTQGAKASA